jgi:hypothetical protein
MASNNGAVATRDVDMNDGADTGADLASASGLDADEGNAGAEGAEGVEHEDGQAEGQTEGDGQDEEGAGEAAAKGAADDAGTDADLVRDVKELLSFGRQRQEQAGQQGGQQNGQGQQGQQQGAQGGQGQQAAPIIGEDFVKKAAEHMDEAAVDGFVKPLVKMLNEQFAELRQFRDQIKPDIDRFRGDIETRQKMQVQAEHQAVHGWFDKLKGAEARYGTPEKMSDAQFASRDRIYRGAKTLMGLAAERAKAGGRGLSFEQALKLAEAADRGEETPSQATQQARGALVRRARGITVPPGRRGSQAAGGEQEEERAHTTAAKKFMQQRHSSAD